MALSESQIPPDAQHYLVCGTEDCKKNSQFYCNDCHQPMCEQCNDKHKKSPQTKIHEVVPYKQRKRQIPRQKCKIHPTKDIDLLCEECQIPLCFNCASTKEHRGHVFTDLQMVFTEKCSSCHVDITKIRSYFEPTSQDLKKEIARNVTEIKSFMEGIRTSMKADAESLKKLVDTVTSENMKQVDKIELSILQTLNGQNQEIDDYIKYLNELIKTFYGYLSASNIEQLTFALKSEILIIRPIPETSKPVPPVFTAGQYSKEDVAKLLGRLWVSDRRGNLVQRDLQGNQLQKIRTNGSGGYHTVTQDGDLIYTDKDNNVINRITQNNAITKFIQTGDWRPLSIHSSHINGDFLVGMNTYKEGKVIRYNKTGTEIQNIQRDNKGQELYELPHYITENINGDVCVSDYNKDTVVVVDKSGQHRFSYTGQRSTIFPFGICTDVLGHILVCDHYSNTVHLLDQDGQFLSLLLTSQQGVKDPRSVCVDDENNLWVGQRGNKVPVYKYLQ
uniref:Tripartite motif-containing protein 2 n=1 Tax=Magallana gigas TaxID=29159 RepID=K1QKY1_MAGGI